jgi:hypothetical protein
MALVPEIGQFVAAVRLDPRASDAGLVDALVRQRVDPLDAERLLAFVPMAFEHERLSQNGVRLPTGYEVRDLESGRSRRGVLAAEPLYVAARALALGLGVGPLRADQVSTVLWR